ncbi:hypothetical protein [Azotobacter salinestris]|uniref:hypothetical protein n=1 Tax=Azotobacter salinestris TaxID=69964 RepID=UPI0032DE7F56
MHRISFLLAGALLLAGCVGGPTTRDGGLSSAARYQGHLVMLPEMHIFVPCNAEAPLWLVTDAATGHRLEAQYASLVSEPYEEAFAVLRGTPGPQLDCRGCRDFPGSFRVSEIIEYRQAEAGDCR